MTNSKSTDNESLLYTQTHKKMFQIKVVRIMSPITHLYDDIFENKVLLELIVM